MNKEITLYTSKEKHRRYSLGIGAHLTRKWEDYVGPSLDILLGLKFRFAQSGAGKSYTFMLGLIVCKIYVRINSIGLPKPGALRKRNVRRKT